VPLADNSNSFFAELRRRNVYRVGIAYAIAAWLVLQVIDIVVPLMDIPEWIPKFVLLLLAVGLPIALIFAWAYEMTPEGLKREKDVDRSESITHETGQRINQITIGVLVIAVGFLLADKFMVSEPVVDSGVETIAETEAVAEAVAAPPSIAVIPFVNMSADESSAYFSYGLADTLLHMLAQIREIRVAARTSSFQFRDQNVDIGEIAKKLNVGTVLEGSVQRAGNKVRVTGQLIEAETGFHLWAGIYDRNLDDIFAIQDEIANEVVAALKVSLLGESAERLAQRETENIDAYTEFLLGLNDLAEFSFESLPRAEQHFLAAVDLDPNYSLAWAELGETYHYMQNTGVGDSDEMLEKARDAAMRAIDLDENSATAIAVLGLVEDIYGNDDIAEQLYLRAINAAPNNVTAKSYYAAFHAARLRPGEAIELINQVLELDPLSTLAHTQLSSWYRFLGEYDLAAEEAAKLRDINPRGPAGYYRLAEIEYDRGNWALSVIKAMEAIKVDPNDPELAMMIGDGYISLEMPDEAKKWYDRAVEIDAEHPVSLASPLILHAYYSTESPDGVKLARRLLDDEIQNRQGSEAIAIRTLWADAASNGTYDEALDFLRGRYPDFFEDEPEWRNGDNHIAYFIGAILMRAGEVDQAHKLLDPLLQRAEAGQEAYSLRLRHVTTTGAFNDKDETLEILRAYAPNALSSDLWPVRLRDHPAFDFIRDEPEFIELVASLENHAAEQREVLATMMAEQ